MAVWKFHFHGQNLEPTFLLILVSSAIKLRNPRTRRRFIAGKIRTSLVDAPATFKEPSPSMVGLLEFPEIPIVFLIPWNSLNIHTLKSPRVSADVRAARIITSHLQSSAGWTIQPQTLGCRMYPMIIMVRDVQAGNVQIMLLRHRSVSWQIEFRWKFGTLFWSLAAIQMMTFGLYGFLDIEGCWGVVRLLQATAFTCSPRWSPATI